MDFIVLILAAVAIHRIWNYEEIFAQTRALLGAALPNWVAYPLTCKMCNALWIGMIVAFLSKIDHWTVSTLLQGFAAYPVIRGLVWLYSYDFYQKAAGAAQIAEDIINTTKEAKIIAELPNNTGCSDCEKKKVSLVEEQKRVLSYEKRVVIMTTLSNFNAGYSLSSCVLDQARAIALHNPKWLVQIWGMQLFDDTLWPKNMPQNVELRKLIPAVHWKDDVYDNKTAGLLAATVSRELVALGNACIITHDLLFQRAYLNMAAAIHSISNLKGFRWWHQAHSSPHPLPERPEIPLLYRYSLPSDGDHFLLNLNDAHRFDFMKHYNTSRLVTCPNVRDPRILYSASPEISAFVGATGLLNADIVQILPVSTERSFAKGVQHVVRIFGSLKATGSEVRLVIANSHANGNEKFINHIKEIAKEWGVEKEVIFTSDHFPHRPSAGLTADDTQFLFRISNLFVFPSTAEASSLVLAEATAAGCLVIINSSVPSLVFDVPDCYGYRFGTSQDPAWPSDCPHPDDIAAAIHKHLAKSNANKTQRSTLQTRNLEVIGKRLSEILA